MSKFKRGHPGIFYAGNPVPAPPPPPPPPVPPPPPPPPPSPPTLLALLMSSTAFVAGVSSSGTIINATPGSTIVPSGLPSGLAIDGPGRTWAWTGVSGVDGSFNLTETLGGAVNSPRVTTINYTIIANLPYVITPNSISGTRGGTLTATPAVWGNSPSSVSRQWFVDGTGTGNTTLVFTDSDVFATIEFRETALPGSVVASAWDAAVANAVTMVWSSTDKTADMHLSGDSLTASLPLGGFQSVRTTQGPAIKWYSEHLINVINGVTILGAADASSPYTSFAGQTDSHGAGFRSDGQIDANANEVGGGFTYGVGDIVMIAYDPINNKLYGGKNGTFFVGNPAAGTGGISITPTGVVKAIFQAIFGANQSVTSNFGASAFAYTPPTGFAAPQSTSVNVLLNQQPSLEPGKYQLDITASTNVSGATGLQFKVESPTGELLQTWTTLPFSGGSGSGTYLNPAFTHEGESLRVLARNVGGTASVVAALAPVIPYALQQSALAGINDGFWNYWSSQAPGRDIFEAATLHPSDSMDLISTSLAVSHKDGILPPGMVYPNYAHWDEVYNPAQNYPSSATSSDDNYLVCVLNGAMWRRTSHTPRSGVAPDPTDPLGSVSGWQRDYFADGSVVGMDARGMPTMLPADTNLTIRFSPAWAGFKPSRYPVTVHCATEPGVKFTLMNPVNVSQTNVNLGAGTFDLVYTGDGGVKLVIDRTGAAISSAFFLSGVPAYEVGAPAADIGSPYPCVDKIADFQPFHAMRNMSAQPTNRDTTGVHNGMTAANSVPTGGRRLWKYDVDMANAQDTWLIANGHGHAGVWVNVQDNADNSYHDAMAAYYLANLNPNITVYLELGNERWNLGFTPARELYDRALALGIGNHQLHARESVAMAARWRTVFGGSASRVNLVLNWQTVAAFSIWAEMLDFENTYLYTDYIAHSPYWGTNGYADYSAGCLTAISANNYAAFEAACDTMMQGFATSTLAVTKGFYDWIPGYSVGKGLNKNRIKVASYEGGPQLLVDQGTFDANLGAGMGARAYTFAGQYHRSAAHALTYADWINKMMTRTPHIYMAFDYNGTAVGWAHMDRMGNQSDIPYATLKTKALAIN
jgi:hypothetical protein